MRFAVLGPLEVLADDGPLSVGGPQQRALLAALLVHPNESVSAEQLAIALWGEEVAQERVSAVHVNISRLRKALKADGRRLETTSGGYRLRVAAGNLDMTRFAGLVEDARAAQPQDAWRLASAALELWRGEPLVDVTAAPFASAEIERLRELRLAALETRAEAAIGLGRQGDVIAQLQELAAQHPDRESVTRLLMVALYNAGRHADALEAFRRMRAYLSGELGLEPSPGLRALEQAILTHHLATPSRRPQFPSPAGVLVGRERERRAIAELLTRSDVRVLTLIGPGGVGKTRLALEVAGGLELPPAWIELAGVERADDVATALVHALGLEPLPGEAPENTLTRCLEAKELLVVVDSFEHVIEAAPLLGRVVTSAPGVTLLVTSRQPLELVSEHCYPVGPLELQAATLLFCQTAVRRDPSFAQTTAITQICERLDGLPLAIELAAARMPLFSPEELLTRLDDALAALGPGPRDAPDRQRTLRASIEWSYRLLESEEQVAFAAFSVFAGGAELDAAEAVTSASPQTLHRLVARNLLYRAGDRLRMLDTVRAFALERLTASVRRRHLQHYLAVAQRADSEIFTRDEPQALHRMDRNIDNLRAALAWGIEHEPQLALKLAIALGKYWNIRGEPEGPRRMEAAIAAAGVDAAAVDRAQANIRLSFLREAQNLDGTGAARTALTLGSEANDRTVQSTAHFALAGQLFDDHPAAARRHAREALLHAQAVGDESLIADAHRALAWVLPREEHEPHLEAAITRLRDRGSRRHESALYTNLAQRATHAGRYDEALELATAAVSLVTEDRRAAARALANLGFAQLFTGHQAEAADTFVRQLRIVSEQVAPALAAEGLAGLAAVSAARGDHHRCAVLLGAATRLGGGGHLVARAELHRRFYQSAYIALGQTAWQAGMRAGAQLDLRTAIEASTTPVSPRLPVKASTQDPPL